MVPARRPGRADLSRMHPALERRIADAQPFGNAIPGGERKSLHAITTTSELEAIVLRTLHYLDRHSDRLVARDPDGAEDSTTMPYTEVSDKPRETEAPPAR